MATIYHEAMPIDLGKTGNKNMHTVVWQQKKETIQVALLELGMTGRHRLPDTCNCGRQKNHSQHLQMGWCVFSVATMPM